MDVVIAAVKNDLPNCLSTGQTMLVSLFVVAVFVRYVGLLSHPVSWADVIVRLVIGFVLLQNYILVMDTTRDIVTGVDQMVNPNQDFVSQYATMSNNAEKIHQASIQPSILSQVTNTLFGWLSLHTLIINLSFIFYAVISKVMEAVRYTMTAILYKMGPVLIPLVLFQSTGHMVKGWFVSYVSVLSWPILWHIVLAIAVTLAGTNQGLEQFACMNFAVCFVLVFSPFIVNHLVAGIGAGSSSAMAGLMSSQSTLGLMTTVGHGTVSGVASKFVQPLMQKYFPQTNSPTVSAGKFKDTMMGGDNSGGKP